MKEKETIRIAQEQEKEIANILIESSLYVDMSLSERQRVLNYLVTSYFNPVLDESSRAFLKVNRTPPSM